MLGKTLSAAASLALLAAAPADAACTQANSAGHWAVYIATSTQGFTFWLRCGLAINPAGTITEGSCAQGSAITPVTGAVHLAVPANCVYTATIGLFDTLGSNLTVNHSTMSLDKQTILGVASTTSLKFSFKMLKVK